MTADDVRSVMIRAVSEDVIASVTEMMLARSLLRTLKLRYEQLTTFVPSTFPWRTAVTDTLDSTDGCNRQLWMLATGSGWIGVDRRTVFWTG